MVDGMRPRVGLSRGLIVAVLSLGILVNASGCFGSFRVTKAVHTFNKEVSDNKAVQELVFLVLVILPVYGIATWADALVVNSIEFWTGENPVGDSSTKVIETEDGIARMERLDANRIQVNLTRTDGSTEAFTLERCDSEVRALDGTGQVIACAATRDGKPVLVHAAE